MQNQITELSPEQREKLSYYRDKWDLIELRTEPVDLEKSKLGMAGLLEALGLPQPSEFFYFKSPAEAFGKFDSWSRFIVGPLAYKWNDLSDFIFEASTNAGESESRSIPVELSLRAEIDEALEPKRDFVDWFNSWADDCIPEDELHRIVYRDQAFDYCAQSEEGSEFWLIEPDEIIPPLRLLDYYSQALGVSLDKGLFDSLSLLAQNSSLIFAFHGVVVFIDTPMSFKAPRKMPDYYRGGPLGQDPVYPKYGKGSREVPPSLDPSDHMAVTAWTEAQELIRAEKMKGGNSNPG